MSLRIDICTAAFRRIVLAASAAASVALTGCAAMYVDGNFPEAPKAEYRQPAQAPAVQLIFEFQTKGAPNARATEYLKDRVRSQVQDSGLFSTVSVAAAPRTGLLTITINNVPLTDNAAAKGFATGLTFGLAGSTVADGYDATLRYTPATSAGVTSVQGKHVIHTSLGTGSPPAGAIKTSGGDEAVTLMLKQLVSRLLRDLSKDSSFPAGAPATNAADAAKQL